jgi:hypothetical protein
MNKDKIILIHGDKINIYQVKQEEIFHSNYFKI